MTDQTKERISFYGIITTIMVVTALMITCGCIVINPNPDPDRATYLAGKTAVYALWRSGAVDIDDLRTAQPHVAALYAALNVVTEAELDATLADTLATLSEGLTLESDRAMIAEIVAAVLDDLALADPALLESHGLQVARLVVGGMLDGIALAEQGAAE